MHKRILAGLLFLLITLNAVCSLRAQGTAFTYQGRLDDGGSPAGGIYDLTFALYPSTNVVAAIVAGPVTNSAVFVTNGLFTATLDFGAGVFTGTNYWLGIGVRTNGASAFVPLTPRQPLMPTPYAIFANTASNLSGTLPSTQLSGALPSAQISGTYAGTVNFNNGGNSFSGTFSGNGNSLSNLNASQLTVGTVADARLTTNVALLNGNQTFTGASTFTNLYGNSFSGSFFGNGLVGWIGTNGTAIQAQIDHGYLLLSPLLTRVTLPTAPAVGDIVRISGAGAGGWLVAENSGQSIFGTLASFGNAGFSVTPVSGNYQSVAASADGTRMYAVGIGITGVYASSDSGQNWNPISTGYIAGYCYSVACSADGKTVYTVSPNYGGIVESTNSGATWFGTGVAYSGVVISCTANGSQYFNTSTPTVCSGDGTCRGQFSGSSITLSTNSGSSYFSVPVPAANVSCLAISGDAIRLVAGCNPGLLYASADRGTTWKTLTSTNQSWSGAWISPGGGRFAGTVSGTSPYGGVYNYDVNLQPGTTSTNSTISGSQGSAVELQYIGGNKFMPVSSSGTIWSN